MLIRKLAAVAVVLGQSSWSFAQGHVEPDEFFEPLGGSGLQWSVQLDDVWAKRPEPPHWPPPHGPPHEPPHPPPNVENKTIYQALKDDDRFSRLFKIVNFADDIASILDDPKASLTFFAPPNRALRPPKHHHHHHHHDKELDWGYMIERAAEPSTDLLEDIPLLEAIADTHQLDKDHDEDKKKEIFKKIVTAILSYHILPTSFLADDLAKNSTFATHLTLPDSSLDGKPQRIRVSAIPRLIFPPGLAVNLRSRIIVADVKAANGVIHVVNHPIFPPSSIFQTLFFFSDVFSIFTSAVQRVGLGDAIEWRYVPGKDGSKGSVQGSPSTTVFVPTNKAFATLPKKLKTFLFSPFGEHVLKKLIQFHIVPELIVHNWIHNATDSLSVASSADLDLHEALQYARFGKMGLHHTKKSSHERRHARGQGKSDEAISPAKCGHLQPPHIPHPEPVYAVNLTLPTLLANHTLYVNIAQYEWRLPLPPHKSTYHTKVVAHGVNVGFADGVARNGALHIIDRVLNPRKDNDHHHHDDKEKASGVDEWDGWEDWLIKWADEN
ncbi:unnamed protein product [Somion occarium]|uniref:FAS1 domain-containing protein n=1 Tax=Somion occarium TaxID=3059160 RepID=A0ABP1DA01_9APHY